ncbi:MAG: hypothetical protein RLZZ330_154 [Actinomycetota bacterium]
MKIWLKFLFVRNLSDIRLANLGELPHRSEEIVRNKISLLVVFSISFSLLVSNTASASEEVTTSDQKLHQYIDEVSTSRIPFIVTRSGMKWFVENTKADIDRIGRLPLWSVNPGRINAEKAVESLSDSQIFLNNIYSIPTLPKSDVADTYEEADHVAITGADELQADGYKGAGQAVAILDTGIEASHPYFEDDNGDTRIVAQACFVYAAGESLPCKNGQDTDFSANAADISHMTYYEQEHMNHGTHVAGLAAGNGNVHAPGGIAPEADIVAVRVFGTSGASDIDILNALEWVAANADTYNIASVNLSLGGGLYSAGECYSNDANYLDYWYRVLFQDLIDVGVAPLVATGNDEVQNKISSPACVEPAIGIGSTNARDSSLESLETISYFTNISPQLDLLAPGHNVTSSLPGGSYGLMSGTSMATPVVAGSFALLQGIENKPVDQWLAILKSTGTPLDGDVVENLPRINLGWAACEVLDCLIPPRNLTFTTSQVSESSVSWTASPYGAPAQSFEINYGSNSVLVSASQSSALVEVEDFSDTIKIRSKSGSATSDWAEFKPFVLNTANSYKVKSPNGRQIIDVQLAGDFCTSDYEPFVRYKYETSTATLRNIWVSGADGFVSYAESLYVPAFGEALNTDNKTKQILISDPVAVLSSNSKAFVVSSKYFGPEFSFASLYTQVMTSPHSPGAPSGFSAVGGPSRAVLSWNADGATKWRIVIDDQVVQDVDTNSAIVPLTPGQHDVAVCAVEENGLNTYTSKRNEISLTALDGIYQEISFSSLPSLNAGGSKGTIQASSTSSLALDFASSTPDICQVIGSGLVTPISAGLCQIQISQTGNSEYASAEPVTVSMNIGAELPKTVTNLTKVVKNGRITFSWKAPANAISAAITKYIVKFRIKKPGKPYGAWKQIELPINQRTYKTSSLPKGTKVSLKVFASSSNGNGPTSFLIATVN